MATTRSRRRSAAPSDDQFQSGLTTVEHLILAQSVWELGADSWPSVAKVLTKHPLTSRPKSYFTAQSCHAMYDNMVHEAGLEASEDNGATRAPRDLQLAQKYYQARVLELRELITIEEGSFKRTLTEIEEIQSGLWDEKIKAQTAGATPDRPDTDAIMESPSRDIVVPSEEVFGSDLSGMTETGSPAGQSPAETTPPNKPTVAITDPQDQQSEIIVQPEDQSSGPVVASQSPPKAEEAVISEGSVSSSGIRTPVAQPTSIAEPSETQPLAVEGPGSEENVSETPEPVESGEQPAATENTDMKIDEQVPSTMGPMTAPDIPQSQTEAEDIAMDDGDISGEEPLQNIRRSTRRRMSSVSSALPPARLSKTKKSRLSRETDSVRPTETEPESPKIENEEPSTDGPKVEDDQDPLVSQRRRKRKASFAEGIGSPRDKKRTRDDSEPVDDDDHGPGSNFSRKARRGDRTEEQVAFKRFQNVIGMLHSQISQHRNGNIFHNPIKNSEAPDYHEIVKRPIDLKTIKAKVKDGLISNSLEFQRDIYLMFANAMMYNRPGSDVHIMAEDVSDLPQFSLALLSFMLDDA
ncbi:hypothetical protein BD779DRAFT_1667527 [Infundibulicybe gibba]|nr:hypothetical protein BD779DRAFT_1667527 [Infundibulicybe gibba]